MKTKKSKTRIPAKLKKGEMEERVLCAYLRIWLELNTSPRAVKVFDRVMGRAFLLNVLRSNGEEKGSQ